MQTFLSAKHAGTRYRCIIFEGKLLHLCGSALIQLPGIAHCTQGGESIDQAIAWSSDELEGFMRGGAFFKGSEAIFRDQFFKREIASPIRKANEVTA